MVWSTALDYLLGVPESCAITMTSQTLPHCWVHDVNANGPYYQCPEFFFLPRSDQISLVSLVCAIITIQFGGWGLKNPQSGPFFSSIFDNSRKKKSQAPWVTFALSLLAVITAMCQASTCGQVWASGPGPLVQLQCSKRVETGCAC